MNSKEPLSIYLLSDLFELRARSLYTLQLAEELVQREIHVRVGTTDASWVSDELREQLQIEEYPHIGYPLWGRVVRELLVSRLKSKPPHLIHIQSPNLLAWGTWIANRLHCPAVVTLHTSPNERLLSDLKRSMCEKFIAIDETIFTTCRTLQERVIPIPAGIKKESLDPSTSEVLQNGHSPVVGYVGPLESNSGLIYLLGAAQKVLSLHPHVEFVIAGTGPEEERLRRLAERLGILENVTFLPQARNAIAPLNSIDIACSPHTKAGEELHLLQAMSLGRAVISTDLSDLAQTVQDHSAGLIVPAANSQALANAICHDVSDPISAQKMAENARDLVHHNFSLQQMVDLTLCLYEQIITDQQTPNTVAM